MKFLSVRNLDIQGKIFFKYPLDISGQGSGTAQGLPGQSAQRADLQNPLQDAV